MSPRDERLPPDGELTGSRDEWQRDGWARFALPCTP
jgi:hypothetical protein